MRGQDLCPVTNERAGWRQAQVIDLADAAHGPKPRQAPGTGTVTRWDLAVKS